MTESGQLVRQWKLIRCLASRRYGATIQELSAETGVSVRTIQRDLNTLREVGFPLDSDDLEHGLKRWRLASSKTCPDLILNYDEIAALYLGRKLLAPLQGTVFGDAALSAMNKVRAGLPESALRYLDKLGRIIYHTSFGSIDYQQHREIVETLRTGVEDRRIILISYLPARATEPVTYEIYPLGLVLYRESFYLVAFSVDRRAIRHFKVNRIESADLQGLTFELPSEIKDFALSEHFAHCLGVFSRPGPPIDVRIRFTHEVARFVEEAVWHPSQKITKKSDGSVIVQLSLSALEEVKSWVLSFGAAAEVLEPQELRQTIAGELQTLLEKYSAPAPRGRAGSRDGDHQADQSARSESSAPSDSAIWRERIQGKALLDGDDEDEDE